MKLISEFNKSLSLWFNAHGITNLEFVEGEDFCYYPSLHTVQWGMLTAEKTDNNFRQFFHEYGARGIDNTFIISLLHEVGHYMTIHYFDQIDLENDAVAKDNRLSDGTIDTNYWYWELPIEIAANMWAINWMNEHPAETQELYELCAESFEKIMSDEDILEQITDWQTAVESGEYEPLYIYEED